VTVVENRTVGNFNANLHKGSKKIDQTYIMAVVVLGTYAQADASYAGQMYARANGSKACTNPSFVPRGSGG